MSSSIIRKDLPYDRRERRSEVGRQGEMNVGNLLASHFGIRNVSYGFDNYSEGTDGYPDMVLKIKPPIAIEVKSISPFTKRKQKNNKYVKSVGYVAIRREQWYNQICFAKSRNARLILIVEVRMRDRGLYFWFDEDKIEEYMNKLDGQRVHISFFNVLSEGVSLMYPKDLEYLEYWNNNSSFIETIEVLKPLI